MDGGTNIDVVVANGAAREDNGDDDRGCYDGDADGNDGPNPPFLIPLHLHGFDQVGVLVGGKRLEIDILVDALAGFGFDGEGFGIVAGAFDANLMAAEGDFGFDGRFAEEFVIDKYADGGAVFDGVCGDAEDAGDGGELDFDLHDLAGFYLDHVDVRGKTQARNTNCVFSWRDRNRLFEGCHAENFTVEYKFRAFDTAEDFQRCLGGRNGGRSRLGRSRRSGRSSCCRCGGGRCGWRRRRISGRATWGGLGNPNKGRKPTQEQADKTKPDSHPGHFIRKAIPRGGPMRGLRFAWFTQTILRTCW